MTTLLEALTPDANDFLGLSYDAIDTKPIDYDFTDHPCLYDGEGTPGWRVYEGTLIPEDTELEIDTSPRLMLDPDDGYIERVELDPDTYVIEAEDENGIAHYELGDDEWLKIMRHYWPKLDVDEIGRAINGDALEDWFPAMNYVYPLPSPPPDDWKTRVSCCTCVEIDGAPYLALTGGGMDMSWEICESFIALGYYPPAHFAELPSMAGRGESKADRAILAACRRSLEAMVERHQAKLDRLTSLYNLD